MAAPTELLELAEEADGEVAAGWGHLEILLPGEVDLDRARAVVGATGAGAVAFLGVAEYELDLSADPPVQSQLNHAATLAPSAAIERQVQASGSAWTAAGLLAEQLEGVRITYTRGNWCPTSEIFQALMADDWLSVVDGLSAGVVRIGERELVLEELADVEHAVLAPANAGDPDDGELAAISDHLWSLADAAAWRNVAVGEERSEEGLSLQLHSDHHSLVVLTPGHAGGGVALLSWLRATDDANRNEALRHVLRFLTATSNVLPDARTVQTLAERQRIALARENAAEVHRAISEGRAETAAGLDNSRTRFATLVEETSKTLQATVVASIGVVALVARNDGLLPGWLLVLVSVVATASVLGLVVSRWRQLGEVADEIGQLHATLDSDPLLPAEDRRALQDRVAEFGGDRRRRAARVGTVLYAAMAVAVVWAATGWLLTNTSDDRDAEPIVALEGFIRSAGGVTELCTADVSAVGCSGERYIVVGIDVDVDGPDVDPSTGWSVRTERISGVLRDGVLESAVVRD